MNIYILSKKQILLIVIIILLAGGCLNLFLEQKRNSYDFPVNSNYVKGNSLEEKIRDITNEKEKVAYLTFDDGPNRLVTPKILDILKQENVKASFFVIGKHVDSYPEIVKRAYEEGHYIANHGYSHKNELLYKSEESFMREIQRTDEAIAKAIGKEIYYSYIFRFPNGYMAPLYKKEKQAMTKVLSKMNYTYLDWNCLNHDSMKKYSKDQLLENLKKSANNKNVLVILMHDTKDVSDSSLALQDSIRYLKSQGYSFRNFNDLI